MSKKISSKIAKIITFFIVILIIVIMLTVNRILLSEKLVRSVKRGDVLQTKILLKQGASVNATDVVEWYDAPSPHPLTDRIKNIVGIEHGSTVLMIASASGYTEIVQILLSEGADVNHGADANRYGEGSNALYLSDLNGHKDISKMLVMKGAKK